jgi:hypothetical protein
MSVVLEQVIVLVPVVVAVQVGEIGKGSVVTNMVF